MMRDRFFLLAAGGALLWVIGLLIDRETAMLAFLAGFATVLFCTLGALFFVLMHHVVDAGWSTVVRRWAEQMLVALPVLAGAALVVVLGTGDIYHWAHPDPADPLFVIKEPWLNRPFFVVRLAFYFAVWIALARVYRNGSLAQDVTGDPAITLKLRKWSGPALIAYGVTTSFAAIDLLMTPDYHWYSTMFGVYVWSQGALAFFAVLALLAFRFRKGELAEKVPDHTVNSIGLWLFAFAAFWGYLAASQWLLIWYANIPEETYWMMDRWKDGWQVLGSAGVAFLFVAPFVLLMPAENKRKPILAIVAGIALLGHWLTLLWVVLPVGHHLSVAATLLAAPGALAFVSGMSAYNVRRALADASPYPTQDPRLPEAVPAAVLETVLETEGGH